MLISTFWNVSNVNTVSKEEHAETKQITVLL